MTKRPTKAADHQHLIKVGYLFLGENKQLVDKRHALSFGSHAAALQHASAVFNDKNEHKYKIVPRG